VAPIHEYTAVDPAKACDYCRGTFERLERPGVPPLKKCPRCGAKVRRVISNVSIGYSKSGLDDRAKAAGFHKLKRLGRGEYEKQY